MRTALFSSISLMLTLLFLSGSTYLKAQDGYSLDFQVKGWQDTTVYLAYYYGESTYIKDTARVSTNGQFSFESDKPLLKGMYMLVRNKAKALEFLVGENQRFKLETDTADYIKNMQVYNDVNNKVFYDNMRFNQSMNQKAQPWIVQMNDSLANEKQKEKAREGLKKLNEEVTDELGKVSKKHEGTLIAAVLKAQVKVEVPQDLDKEQQFQYYRAHFFDNFDLANDALLRLPTPLYRKKIDEYLDNLFSQSVDSLKKAVQDIVSKAKPNPETYKYAVWSICSKYQNPKYMGQDGLFVYIYEEYFATGEMDFWANESLKKNLKERADLLKKCLIGKVSQNMIMLDENLEPISLHGVKNKYTVIYFYDPDCGHCKKETPKLNDFYKNTKYDVEVFAVSADTSMVKMKKYIRDNNLTWLSVNGPRTLTPHYQKLYDATTTPTIYLIDEKKKIIAKKIKAIRLEEFLDNYELSN